MYLRYNTAFFFLCALLIFSILRVEAQTYSRKDLEKYLAQELESEALKPATIGIAIYNITNQKWVYRYNDEKVLVPASTMKTLTTAAALDVLGENYTYETYLQYDGNITRDSILKGNLYITGTGDPTLGSDRYEDRPSYDTLMMDWAKRIKDLGIKRVEGRVIGDGSAWYDNHVPDGWQWNDLGNYYGASAQALNMNENTYKIIFKPNFRGRKSVIIGTEPTMKDMVIVNHVTTAGYGTGDQSYIYGSPYTNIRFIQGSIQASRKPFKVKGAMPDPAIFIAEYLTDLLSNAGVTVTQTPSTVFRLVAENAYQKRKRTTFHTIQSPPLKDIVKAINEWSVNLYAEAVLKSLGLKMKGVASADAGADALKDYWEARELYTTGMSVQDGSGLSHTNLVAPKTFIDMFKFLPSRPYFDTFMESLAIAGEEGTLRRLTKGTFAEGNLKGKSGSLFKVACYVGYVENRDGDLLCFALMSNNHATYYSAIRARWERVMIMMAGLDD